LTTGGAGWKKSRLRQAEADVTDRDHSPAYQMLPRSARRVFAAIERAIGNGSSAAISFASFRLDHHIGRRAMSPSLKLLDHLGLIDQMPNSPS